jgi:hypothetical protein
VDLEPGVWTKCRIVIDATKARLFVHGANSRLPALPSFTTNMSLRGYPGGNPITLVGGLVGKSAALVKLPHRCSGGVGSHRVNAISAVPGTYVEKLSDAPSGANEVMNPWVLFAPMAVGKSAEEVLPATMASLDGSLRGKLPDRNSIPPDKWNISEPFLWS